MKAKSWRELPPGAVILDAGNAREVKTGSWRTFRPVWVEENCSHCLFCWLFCPDMAVIVKDGKMAGFDYDYCKGCGICAFECPGKKGKKAIFMEEESK
ncbi:pyruvate ferredoxin oxidoreductase delta subunit [Thermodesulfitimonas autotrophica]|jgi:pyruvate ferredoxin oxidoreductase delta subunit|uniref:Pyruvate ferredoxin oxidoreductase delta subunit n=1 Tax=Thermodesulfitimonas autotrophica TaxID=1894989 RepID=A0A3N5AQ38_9THEO|nr:4Fe-4S binding protein [Thermodesulfitimonas autotrophica]RPF47149.1 pyruvate ferredoxin oxidoreductase delta subunit [Thermodesulfitimonas autotrophica]